jgi:signal transduction histidine kinase
MPRARQDRLDLAAAYEVEQQAVVRARVELGAALFLVFIGLGCVIEYLSHGERMGVALPFFALGALESVFAVLALRLSPMRSRPVVVGVALMAALALQMQAYNLVVGGLAERLAMSQVCLLTTLALVIPWGWRAQATLAATALGGFAVVLPYLTAPEGGGFPALGLAVGAIVSVAGAAFHERFRRDAFVQTVLLREEAETSAALMAVGQLLSTHLDVPDMLEHVNRFAVDTLGCFSSGSYVWDDDRQAYRMVSTVGLSTDLETEAKRLEFREETMPILGHLRRGEVVELEDTCDQALIPPTLMAYFGVTSSIYAPILRGEELIAVLGYAWNDRRGPFTPRERRLALGIAQATAIAMQNGKLICDLQAASQLKSDFVATMSHELRTPINIIVGYSDLLASEDPGPLTPDQHELLAATRRSAVELLALVNATLDLNRLDSGADPVEVNQVSLVELFEELAAEVAALRPAAVALRWRPGPAGRRVCTDRAKLKTVLKNLIGNALKFTDAGTVEVVAVLAPGSFTVTVRDTGIGIPTNQIPVIFEMFRQVDGSYTRRHGGVGLGLHIVKRLVDALGGTVSVESALGQGATFTVVLPELGSALQSTGTG